MCSSSAGLRGPRIRCNEARSQSAHADEWRGERVRVVSLCACGAEIEPLYSFCPKCGIDLCWSTEVRRAEAIPANRSLCRTLRACATRTFERLAHAHFNGSVPGEETFTDLNLQDLDRLHGDRMAIHKYTRHQETHSGADWEWWFYSGNIGFGMRVQAKRAMRGGGYKLEHVVRGTGRSQSRLLVQDALATGCLPVYVLYNHRNWVPRSRAGQVMNCRHGQGEEAQMGCTMVSALTVHAALRKRPTRPAFVRDQSVPWHRILCDAPHADGTWLDIAHAETRSLHIRGLGDWLTEATEMPQEVVRRQKSGEKRANDRGHERSPVGSRGALSSAPLARVSHDSRVDILGDEYPFEEMDQRSLADLDAAEQRLLDKIAAADPESLTLPHYRGLTDVSSRKIRRLPDRIMAMVRTARDLAEPPDERAAGAVLVNLGDLM
ncbi:DUF6615 family protein [Streptomyces sp. NPDC057363]|uniref:DUF6615 family protein n=1 Tax=Streptomyces sp. NPDC057363 TaxID=3346107 RepID=UPI0036301AC3